MDNWKKKFAIIAVGQSISLILSSAVEFSIIWWIAKTTGSAFMMGMSGLVAFLPSLFISPIAGVIADRYNRKYVCIVADMFVGLWALIFSVFIFLYDMPIWSAFIILFFRALGGAFHRPALSALFPQIVPKDKMMKIGGLNQLIASGAFLIGPALGAVMYASMPFYMVLLSDFVGAIIASIMMLIIYVPNVDTKKGDRKHPIADFKEGIEVYKDDKKLFLIFIVEFIVLIFTLPLSSLYPLMTSEHFGGNEWNASIVEVSFALGMMISSFVFSFIKVRDEIKVSYFGLVFMGVTTMLGGMMPANNLGWIIFSVICIFMGMSGNIHGIPLVAYMQINIPVEKLGRAFSIYELAASVAMPLGLIIASPLAESIGVARWFFVSGVFVIIISTAGVFINRILIKRCL